MDRVMLWHIISSLTMGMAALWVYIYYWHRHQFDDPEEVKYQMLREENDDQR